MFGLSQQPASGGTVSWGVGAAVQNIESQRDIKVTLKPSIGMFYDRNNSLQWSAILNDTGDNRFRLNMYPLDQGWIKQAGWFLSINDEGDISAGVSLSLPLGIGVSSN